MNTKAVVACAANLEGAIITFLDGIRPFGFEACAAGAWSGVGEGRAYRLYFHTGPRQWNAVHQERSRGSIDSEACRGELTFLLREVEGAGHTAGGGKIVDVAHGFGFEDPVLVELPRRAFPFLLSKQEAALRTAAGMVINVAYGSGWTDVFAVPLHGPGGYQALVSMAAYDPVTLDTKKRADLATMASAIHTRCQAATGFGFRPKLVAVLTARQVDCMRWIALGKTDAEIGALVDLNPPTVRYHVEKVKRLLGVKNRAEAAALLTQEGVL